MLVKLGNIVQFHFGPAVIAFVLCVAMSMIASISFDPHAIWEDSE
jgi:paraquat-inducible protein A